MAKKNSETKEKKIYFSEEIDSRITGYALSLALVVCGLVLQFSPLYFGNDIITQIIKWIFVVIGVIGFIVEAGKIKSGIVGLDNLFLGLFFVAIWFALYWFGRHWFFNTIGFFLLIFGAFGFFQGLQQIIYSISKIPKEKKERQPKEKTRTDILLFLTKLFGVVLVIIQIIKAVIDLSV
ncbi:MAG: hypothetical protein IKC45_03680 [Clostridia bacterium]|nr:hypothetical protein [Clostridia bacterium]